MNSTTINFTNREAFNIYGLFIGMIAVEESNAKIQHLNLRKDTPAADHFHYWINRLPELQRLKDMYFDHKQHLTKQYTHPFLRSMADILATEMKHHGISEIGNLKLQ